MAETHGRELLDLERGLHLAPEHALNAWLAAHHALTQIVVFWYTNAHGAVTFGLIGWLWWRRPELLPPLRAALVAVNLAALAVFWTWPVAPPRMLPSPQFLDLAALVRGESPRWPPGAVSLEANQLSAFPKTTRCRYAHADRGRAFPSPLSDRISATAGWGGRA
ncbi:MAG: phosphatase PAP2 family protein [Actinobacteria bacterium]|nr:phosphatase PAP2 family protein [Actinomycetota bacterium]